MINSLYPIFQHWSEKGSVYLYSDPHFEDEDMAEFFGQMGAADQVASINKVVTKNDYLIILGDFGNPEWLGKIKTTHLVGLMGNHDQSVTKYNKYFEELYSGPLFIAEKILLSHEPINFSFAVNIHGHDHSNVGRYDINCHHLNVAANVIGYKPLSLGKLIKDGLISSVNSIHRETIDMASFRKHAGKYKMSHEFMTWVHNDITWCGSKCDNYECYRNLHNRIQGENDIFSVADFRGSGECPLEK